MNFNDEELEALIRKNREFEELLGRMIRDKRIEQIKSSISS